MRIRYTILSIVFLVICCSLTAQPRLRNPEIYFGGHAGVMASSMIFNPSVQGVELLNPVLAPNGGLVFRYAGHKVCAIQVELNYMQRGWKEQTAGVNYTRQMDYIELPLLMHLYFGGKNVRAFVNFGPQVGYCIRDIALGNTNPNYSHQYLKVQNPFDWGAALGLGLYYRNSKFGLLQLEARGNYSLGSTFKNSTTDYFKFANAVNVSLNLAYMWQFKTK